MAEFSSSTLSMLQHADSMFPNGAVSFSWGLEPYSNRNSVSGPADLEQFLAAQLEGRWANLDRPALAHAFSAADSQGQLSRIDRLIEAQTLPAELRLGSSRMGMALLNVHAKLRTPKASAYLGIVERGHAFGHIPVVQGMLWANVGLSCDDAQLMSAHGLCTGILGAAIRLSVVGHVDAQAIHTRMLPRIQGIVRAPLCPIDEMHSFTPRIEIASMQHEADEIRLFVN